MSDLARRLLSCPRFRWVEGMRIASPPALTGLRVVPGSVVSPHALPDLEDPATVGCVLALVRAALGHNGTSVLVEVRWSPTAPGWRIVRWDRAGSIAIGLDDHPTEAAALVAAMEAAP